MPSTRYSNELKYQVIKEVNETGSVQLVAKKHGLIARSVHNWMRGHKNRDQILEQKKIRELTKALADSRLENELLRELVKKTMQVFASDEKRS